MIWLEIIGVLFGLLYLWLEFRASVWLWPVSIAMPALYIYIYGEAGFYADMGINIYYLLAGIYGWALWSRKRGDGEVALRITHTPRHKILPLVATGCTAMAIIAYILLNYTDSTVAYGDSFTTAASIVALYMLAHKYVEQWLVWLVVDVVCCTLYAQKGLYPTAALYGLYALLAWAGYRRWLKILRNEKSSTC